MSSADGSFRPDRRAMLGGAVGLSVLAAVGDARAAQVNVPPPIKRPPPAKTLPAAWAHAEHLPLWRTDMPGAGQFRAAPLPPDYPPVYRRNIAEPALHVFRPARPNGAAVLVIPGGAYLMVSIDNEGVAIADRLTSMGYHVFVLTYRLPNEGWRDRADVPLQDAQRGARLVRWLAPRFGFDADRLATVGFSAGGHLAATLATAFDDRVYAPVDAIDALSARPAATGLIYPVITMTDPYTHTQSRAMLLGDHPSPALIAHRSPDQHVGAATPPIFLACACDDSHVPIENSEMMMAACRKAGRPVEAHFFQEGEHAFSVGYAGTPSSLWLDLFDLWLKRAGVG